MIIHRHDNCKTMHAKWCTIDKVIFYSHRNTDSLNRLNIYWTYEHFTMKICMELIDDAYCFHIDALLIFIGLSPILYELSGNWHNVKKKQPSTLRYSACNILKLLFVHYRRTMSNEYIFFGDLDWGHWYVDSHFVATTEWFSSPHRDTIFGISVRAAETYNYSLHTLHVIRWIIWIEFFIMILGWFFWPYVVSL